MMFVTMAYAADWRKLGEVTADVSLDRVTVNCSDRGSFKAIRFRVEGATVDFNRVLVRYATGATDDLKFDETLRPGQNSGNLDLRGNKRVIREVILYIKSDGRLKDNKGKGKDKGRGGRREAKVQVWGLK